MKLSAIAGLAVIAAVSAADVVPFEKCPGSYPIEILSMEANAWPPVAGTPLKTSQQINIQTPVTGGTVEIKTKHPFGIKTDTVDFKDFGNFPADGTLGPFELINEGETPSGISGMKFTTRTTGYDQNGTAVYCYTVNFTAQ